MYPEADQRDIFLYIFQVLFRILSINKQSAKPKRKKWGISLSAHYEPTKANEKKHSELGNRSNFVQILYSNINPEQLYKGQ